jgi:hypothetical protein
VTPVDVKFADAYIWSMCGRVIQSSPPIRYALFDGMNVRDSRVYNYFTHACNRSLDGLPMDHNHPFNRAG